LSLKLYNTLSREKEEFEPGIPGRVNMYVCGPTVYNYISVGNSRPVVVFNMVKNYLRYSGYRVTYVQNITDIEDKIINRSNEEGVDFRVLTKKYTEAFIEDLENLEIEGFDEMPFATENIDRIIDLVRRIMEKGYGYEIDGNVYFDVQKFTGYGKLSHQKIEEMDDSGEPEFQKRSRVDFALWKKAKKGEPSWDSPWGRGRPGWHIECSAMAAELLGHNIDIHGGGIDLVFPHHENEIAQYEAAYPGKGNFSNYWMHNGMIEVKEGKMSKSKGLKKNWILKNLLKEYSPNVIKMYILSTHYRSPLEFSSGKLEEAKKALERITNTLKNIEFLTESRAEADMEIGSISEKIEVGIEKFERNFRASMDDDFNSAGAIGIIFDFIKSINSVIQGPDFKMSSYAVMVLNNAFEKIIELGGVLGFNFSRELEAPERRETAENEGEEIEELIEQRNNARKNGNFKEADRIREKLDSMGIILEDRKEGTIWKYKD
jgi:cysteinyl-tRNA synthetase